MEELIQDLVRQGLIIWGMSPKSQTAPMVPQKYYGPVSTWAILQAILEVFEANYKYAKGVRDTLADQRREAACKILLPRLEALERYIKF